MVPVDADLNQTLLIRDVRLTPSAPCLAVSVLNHRAALLTVEGRTPSAFACSLPAMRSTVSTSSPGMRRRQWNLTLHHSGSRPAFSAARRHC